MTDTHADAVAALHLAWEHAVSEPGEPGAPCEVCGRGLDAILADPAKRRALLAVLLDTDTVAAAIHMTFCRGRAPMHSAEDHSGARLIAALTREPTDAE